MSRYRVLLHGRNVLLDLDGERHVGGFYIHCCVEASHDAAAAASAIALLRRHPRYLALLEGTDGSPPQPEPTRLVDELEQLPWWERRPPGVTERFVFHVDPDEVPVQ